MAMAGVIFSCAALLYWTAQFIVVRRVVRNMPRLAPVRGRGYKTVSLIVPARNEYPDLEPATLSKLACCASGDEIILVEDRSSDASPAIADKLAAADSRLRVVHIKELPEGWLGKVHALDEGVRLARGEWLLFSDADVYYREGAVAASIAHAEERGLDHLAVIPKLKNTGLLADSAIAVFVRLMALAPGMRNANAINNRSAIGIGAFNLVRRDFFEKTPGFEWLRLEVIDDMGLALMVRQYGGKTAVADGSSFVELYFYRTLAQLRSGMEKGIFAGAQYSYCKLFAGIFIFWLLEMSPFAAFLLGGVYAKIAAAIALVLACASSVAMNRWSGRGFRSALLFPLGDTLGTALALWCGASAFFSGGIKWRGTKYPLSELRKHRRFSFGG